MVWHPDRRCKAGGFWRCRVRERERDRRRRPQKAAWYRTRYQNDPAFAFRELLRRQTRYHRDRLARLETALATLTQKGG